jgi:hypothetical protein
MQRNENVGHPRYNVETYQFASHRVLSRTESNDHESITPDSDLIQPRSKAKRLANALPIALLPTIKCPFVLALRHACLSHFHVRGAVEIGENNCDIRIVFVGPRSHPPSHRDLLVHILHKHTNTSLTAGQ